MEQKELEIAIGELEERVDRLRVLYEQYFLGFEKLEPTVPRKDVDRRFAVLRKENIRNTALRFRLNVVTQKYNTYAMYWTRICRQIEEGTYKRHVKKAQDRFGDVARAPEPSDLPFDLDVDFEDIDDDLEKALAEATAAAASRERLPSDTEPPATIRTTSPLPSPLPVPPSARIPLPPAPRPPAPSAPGLIDRVARPAPLPAGGRAPVLRKIARPADGSSPAGAPKPAPPAPVTGVRPILRPAVRGPSPSSPDLGDERASRPRLPLPSQSGREDDEKSRT